MRTIENLWTQFDPRFSLLHYVSGYLLTRLKLNRTFRDIIVYNDDHVYPEYIVKAGHTGLFLLSAKPFFSCNHNHARYKADYGTTNT